MQIDFMYTKIDLKHIWKWKKVFSWVFFFYVQLSVGCGRLWTFIQMNDKLFCFPFSDWACVEGLCWLTLSVTVGYWGKLFNYTTSLQRSHPSRYMYEPHNFRNVYSIGSTPLVHAFSATSRLRPILVFDM